MVVRARGRDRSTGAVLVLGEYHNNFPVAVSLLMEARARESLHMYFYTASRRGLARVAPARSKCNIQLISRYAMRVASESLQLKEVSKFDLM